MKFFIIHKKRDCIFRQNINSIKMTAKFLTLFLAIVGMSAISYSQDWRGTYKYQRGEGQYELEIYGPPGELEGDFKYTGEGGGYKISLNLVEEGDYLKVNAVKVWEGTYHSESKIKADPMMFKLVWRDGELMTIIGSHTLGGFDKGYQDVMFKK